jgi:hypothetical protein
MGGRAPAAHGAGVAAAGPHRRDSWRASRIKSGDRRQRLQSLEQFGCADRAVPIIEDGIPAQSDPPPDREPIG